MSKLRTFVGYRTTMSQVIYKLSNKETLSGNLRNSRSRMNGCNGVQGRGLVGMWLPIDWAPYPWVQGKANESINNQPE